MPRLPIPIAMCLCLLLLAAPAAQAGKLYRWTDKSGITHYGDRAPSAAPPSEVKVIPFRAEPGAIARLRVQQDGDRYLAWADNSLSGPVEVQLDFTHSNNIAGNPSLPANATVDARGSAVVAVLSAQDPTRGGDFELTMRSVPGDPRARARNVEYLLPLQQQQFRIDQGYGGHFSHTEPEHRYAIDFAADIGTPVLAARDGVVMQVESDFDKAGLNLEKFGDRANFVRILHDDGTMALYAHLKADNGVIVRVGQRVRAGQQIGLSGNTGFSTGPHLHFAVQINRGMRLESIPVRINGPQGPLRLSGGTR
ncbi:peptidoglycan DD-metalloendopeptidase family protein [Lysobacter capsici]|uniref:peptidoglycan DD-metalloendopeptidase family protein n=1 Tax=Lysobacter capsici TaxID=435897 RepID=UPI001E596A5E|nr:peptidoglycan DD-metalloendopeptidase family protein [Lysobacter capsici]